MKTPLLMSIAILAALLLLAAGCDKSAKATDSAKGSDPAVTTIAASDMQMDGTASAGTDEHADHDHGMEGMHHDMDNQADGDLTKSTSPAIGHPYTLGTCPVSGEELGSMGDPLHYNYQGRDIAFCCKGCIPKFEADPAKFIAAIDKQIMAEQMDTYPLTACPVTGDELGEMGESIDRVIDNRLVRFCCEDCVTDFEADPAKYFTKMDAAVLAAQAADYPLKTCLVSGEELGEEGAIVDYVVGTTLVRLCCEDCKHDVDANPAKYLEMVHKAAASDA